MAGTGDVAGERRAGRLGASATQARPPKRGVWACSKHRWEDMQRAEQEVARFVF